MAAFLVLFLGVHSRLGEQGHVEGEAGHSEL